LCYLLFFFSSSSSCSLQQRSKVFFFFSLLIGIITMCIVLSFLHLPKKTQFTMQQFSKLHKFVWINRVGKSKYKNIIVKNECKQWALLLCIHANEHFN
jgi:hypothetical protein